MHGACGRLFAWTKTSATVACLLSISCSRAPSNAGPTREPATGGTPTADSAPAPSGRAAASAPAPKAADAPRIVVFTGMCDASGAVALSDRRFVVADDEDNVLRVYDVEQGGAPLGGTDVSHGLKLPLKKKKKPGSVPV